MRFSKIKSTTGLSAHGQNFMTQHSNWRLGALASAIALLGTLSHLPAQALGLGRITVQSALGEALRAEVEVPEITADEASSLKIGVAAPAAFKAAGLEYSPSLSGVQVSLQKRPDGRTFLSLTSARPMIEPFVDLIIEANWATGRLVRDYTMLFDPPNLRQSAQVAPTAPNVSAVPNASSSARSSASNVPMSPPAAQARNDSPAVFKAPPQKRAAIPRASASAKPDPSKPAGNSQQVTVKAGDTASKIAAQNISAGVSLDQMLVALLKSNPEAFTGGNVNRLKSGAVLDIPKADDAASLPGAEASRNIVAQSKDFNEFRRKLASGVPATQIQSANRQSGGKVQASVEDRAAAAVAPDKLTLSKGALAGTAAAEEKIAKDKQAKDASVRVAELSKNISDLNKAVGVPGTGTGTASAPIAAASSAKIAGLPIDKPVAVTPPAASASTSASTPAVAAAASAPKSVSAPAASAPAVSASSAVAATTVTSVTSSLAVAPVSSTIAIATVTAAAPEQSPVASALPAASAPAAKKPVETAPPAPSFIEELTSSEFVLPGLAALLALLAGFGFYRYKKRNEGAPVDSSFLESRLQPDSFFGASGGQRIDTSESGTASGPSMVYSPSQLDAAGDVDPVAEADVYLAYGRDLQAEEILKEALRTHPTRVAIHSKLLDIYAKRRDVKGFEATATQALNLTGGSGPEWAYICDLGRDLDPANPLYQSGGQAPQTTGGATAVSPATAPSFGVDTLPAMPGASYSAGNSAPDIDFDLDLDFSDNNAPSASASTGLEPTVAIRAIDEPNFANLDMGFAPVAPAVSSAKKQNDDILNFDIDLPPAAAKPQISAFTLPVSSAAAAPSASALPVADNSMLEFDLGSLSLDLDTPVVESPKVAKDAKNANAEPLQVQGPLDIKFALAEEFRALGDSDGARSLATEVVAQAHGALKTKAQAFLNALS